MESIEQNDDLDIFNSYERRVSLLYEEMNSQADSPFGGDEIIGAFFRDTLEMRDNDSEFKSLLEHYMTKREDITHGPYASLLLFRTIHHHTRMTDASYPDVSYLKEGTWQNKINELLADPQIHDAIFKDLEFNRLQSNKESRAWGLLLPLRGLVDNGRFNRPPRILEVGTGRMHLLKMLAMSGQVPGLEYEAITVLNQENEAVDSNSTIAVNQLASRPVEIGSSLGIDIVPMAKAEHMERVFSDSFSPSELLELKMRPKNTQEASPRAFAATRREANYHLLDFATPSQLMFSRANFLNPKHIAFLKPWNFDVIIFSSVMYQHSEKDREIDLSVAKDIIDDNGVILIQDDVEVSKEDKQKAYFYPSWSQSWQYHTLAIDMQNPDELQNLIEWETNLCRTLKFGLGKLAVKGELKTLPELLGIDSV